MAYIIAVYNPLDPRTYLYESTTPGKFTFYKNEAQQYASERCACECAVGIKQRLRLKELDTCVETM